MFFSNTPRPESLRAIADVKHVPYWLDDPSNQNQPHHLQPRFKPTLPLSAEASLVYRTALQAKQADPNRDVILLEAGEIAIGASGRNGGFCAASITHGIDNGLIRGRRNFLNSFNSAEEILTLLKLRSSSSTLTVISSARVKWGLRNEEHQIAEFREEVELATQYGVPAQFFNQEEMRSRINSPTFLAGAMDV